MKGIVLIDKTSGMTSHDTVQEVKKILKVKKAGHSGTLDSNVTGVLVVAIDEATKAMPVLMGLNKTYIGKMKLHGDVDKRQIEKTRKKFVGKIIQTPPIKSRVVRKPRERKIYSFEIHEIKGRDVKFEVKCEKGTYIRKLVHDFGQGLGCGAQMIELRRTEVGPFKEKECIKLEDLKKEDILELEDVLERVGLKKINVKTEDLEKVKNGVPIPGNKIEGLFGIYNEGEIIALGSYKKGKIKPERIFL